MRVEVLELTEGFMTEVALICGTIPGTRGRHIALIFVKRILIVASWSGNATPLGNHPVKIRPDYHAIDVTASNAAGAMTTLCVSNQCRERDKACVALQHGANESLGLVLRRGEVYSKIVGVLEVLVTGNAVMVYVNIVLLQFLFGIKCLVAVVAPVMFIDTMSFEPIFVIEVYVTVGADVMEGRVIPVLSTSVIR
jgi:hypothetical protein